MLIAFNKPHGVLCQFRDPEGRATLADYVRQERVYAAGRLDRDSEGLLLLTDDGALQHRLTDPRHKQPKTYLVQVECMPDAAALDALRYGVTLNDGSTRPAEAGLLDGEPDWLWPRDPPVRFRKSVPTAWITLTLREGRNRQVRRMTAAVGHPTLRLVRTRIGPYALDGLAPGATRVILPWRAGRPDRFALAIVCRGGYRREGFGLRPLGARSSSLLSKEDEPEESTPRVRRPQRCALRVRSALRGFSDGPSMARRKMAGVLPAALRAFSSALHRLSRGPQGASCPVGAHRMRDSLKA